MTRVRPLRTFESIRFDLRPQSCKHEASKAKAAIITANSTLTLDDKLANRVELHSGT